MRACRHPLPRTDVRMSGRTVVGFPLGGRRSGVRRADDPARFRGDWVDLAAFLMMLAGAVDFFQGLIAVVREHYYTVDPDEILVVDLTAWGWILLFWGSVVALSGVALWSRSNIARWVAL